MIAESFERIHRSNLIGMGVLPSSWRTAPPSRASASTRRRWRRRRSRSGAWPAPTPASLLGARLPVDAGGVAVPVVARLDTPMEAAYYQHGGILQYVLRQHLRRRLTSPADPTGLAPPSSRRGRIASTGGGSLGAPGGRGRPGPGG